MSQSKTKFSSVSPLFVSSTLLFFFVDTLQHFLVTLKTLHLHRVAASSSSCFSLYLPLSLALALTLPNPVCIFNFLSILILSLFAVSIVPRRSSGHKLRVTFWQTNCMFYTFWFVTLGTWQCHAPLHTLLPMSLDFTGRLNWVAGACFIYEQRE